MGILNFFRGELSNMRLKRKPRKDRVNVVARYMFLLDDMSYVMILDFQNDASLIKRIKNKKIPLDTLKKEFQNRGTEIDSEKNNEYMSSLIPQLNKEDFILDISDDIGDGTPYNVYFGFFFE